MSNLLFAVIVVRMIGHAISSSVFHPQGHLVSLI